MSGSDLGRRIGKREPFGAKEEAAMLNLVRTADRVQSHAGRLLREHGLSHAQYNVLRILRGLGGPTPILEIAERMLTETPGITGLIDRLEKLEMVERRRCESDRRVIHVVITPRGEAVLKGLDAPLKELQARVCSPLTATELDAFVRLLDKVREPLEGP
ncbi:MarR family winged helix-turn-helix transcriptional regulator [Planctomyces sp. SH-PL62]|uniref:MarR family winged helix-turn-helix transcriptional regulator n=1 Tax=Planctomyces sp. SH-PL62 TaxID=1636152 RepID=UPI00078CA686|nr:MarR family transcriptional regulator [Planctomyces sp. SH-PL62]AMV36090.1 HTH-type transcriptional regulator MhqR [Planctomyces sp. SH-PL62]